MLIVPASASTGLSPVSVRDTVPAPASVVIRPGVAGKNASVQDPRALRAVEPGSAAFETRNLRDEPAGPPPAFKVTILQRLRDTQLQAQATSPGNEARQPRFGPVPGLESTPRGVDMSPGTELPLPSRELTGATSGTGPDREGAASDPPRARFQTAGPIAPADPAVSGAATGVFVAPPGGRNSGDGALAPFVFDRRV